MCHFFSITFDCHLQNSTQVSTTSISSAELSRLLTTTTLCQSQSHIATDGQSISKSWCRAPSGADDQIFITAWQLRSCFCGAPSLTRGRVCLAMQRLAKQTCFLCGPFQGYITPVTNIVVFIFYFYFYYFYYRNKNYYICNWRYIALEWTA
jgi:hypothetical protein